MIFTCCKPERYYRLLSRDSLIFLIWEWFEGLMLAETVKHTGAMVAGTLQTPGSCVDVPSFSLECTPSVVSHSFLVTLPTRGHPYEPPIGFLMTSYWSVS